jgi:uncharacterized membrane protein YphA (DoxX/SURF4 family)
VPTMTTTSGSTPQEADASRRVDLPIPLALVWQAGRVLYGVPMIVFGIQHYIYASFVVTLMQPWLPWRPFWTYFCGTALVAAGLAITVDRVTRLAAMLLGTMIFLFFLLVHIPQVIAQPGDPHQWTYMMQAFTFSGIALLLAATTPKRELWPWSEDAAGWLVHARWLIAIGCLVLGVRQVLGVPFVLGLVPSWPPSQAVWATLAGVLLVASSVGIAVKRARPPALLVGGLLLVFLAAFHLPSLARDPRRGNWGAACKDSILCGGALIVAGARTRTRRSLGDTNRGQ